MVTFRWQQFQRMLVIRTDHWGVDRKDNQISYQTSQKYEFKLLSVVSGFSLATQHITGMGKFNLWSVTSLWSQLIQNIQETTEDGAILVCKLFSVFWGLDCWHSTQWDHPSFNSPETHLKSALPMRRYSVFSKLLTKPNDKREVSQSGHCFFDTAQYRFKGNWSINPPHITNIGCFCIVFIKQPKGKKNG